jgi:hypothetical protein
MGSSSPSTISNFSPQQTNLMHTLLPLLKSQEGTGITPYTGELVAPLNSGYGEVQNMLGSYNPNQFQQGQTGAINQALSGQPSYTANTDPAATANYFQQSVVNPSMRNYNQVTAPAINQGFAANGGTFSTARGVAQATALSNLQAQNAAGLAQTQFSAQQQGQALNASLADSAANRQVQGIGLAQQYANAPLYNAQQLSQALQPFQQNAQDQDAAAYQQWQSQQSYNNPYLANIMAFLGQDGTQTAYQKPDYTGEYIGGGLGVAGAIVGGYFGGPMGAIQGAATGYSVGHMGYNLSTGATG